MHARGLLEVFQKMYVDAWPGTSRDKWTSFLSSDSPVAIAVTNELFSVTRLFNPGCLDPGGFDPGD